MHISYGERKEFISTSRHRQVVDAGLQFYFSSERQRLYTEQNIMDIIQHGSSNPVFEPATFQSQVQRSTDWATGVPLNMVREWKFNGHLSQTIIFVSLFACLFVCLSVCLFVCFYVCLFVCMFEWLNWPFYH